MKAIERLVIGMTLALTSPHAPAGAIYDDQSPPWERCAICHGIDGNTAMAKFPRLAGQSRAYIEKQVRDIRNGRRHNDDGQMRPTAQEISDADIGKVAAYFAALPPVVTQTPATVGADIAACQACHATTTAQPAVGPRLAGQHKDYLLKQMRDFRSGARANDADGVMQALMKSLAPEQIAAIATIYAGPAPNVAHRTER